MGISIFPSTAAEFVSNNFVIDMNDTTNNTADTGGVKQAGPYSMSFSSGDTSFDVYLIDEDGNSVGYSNNTSIVASGLFSTVVILGVASDEVISFLYQGSVNNADGEGDEPGAGAYLESISPSDLPSIDDTATVTGGNFGANTEITFESGATVLPAKNIVVTNSTSLVVTRPDALVEDDAPYTLKAINTGVTPPTGTNAHILVDAVTAGSDPTWVTTSLDAAIINQAYSDTLEATDAEGSVSYSVTTGNLPTGLALNSTTGVISGTVTGSSETFTVTASDDGGNTTPREFTIVVAAATGGDEILNAGGGKVAHVFNSSGTFEPLQELTGVEYLVIAGGGGSRNAGGGAGGYRSSVVGESSGGGASAESTLTLAADTPITVTVGAGGNGGDTANSGSASSFSNINTVGGGRGSLRGFSGANNLPTGGSGGGGFNLNTSQAGGAGTAGQGFNGGSANNQFTQGGGGGAGAAGQNNNGTGGIGVESSITGTPIYRAGGGGQSGNLVGLGQSIGGGSVTGGAGSSGQVIVRYSI